MLSETTWPRRNFKLNLNYVQKKTHLKNNENENISGTGMFMDLRNVIDGPVYLVADAYVPRDKIKVDLRQELSDVQAVFLGELQKYGAAYDTYRKQVTKWDEIISEKEIDFSADDE